MNGSESNEATMQNGNGNGSKKKMSLIILAVFAALCLIGGGWWYHVLQTTVSTDNAKITGDIVDISVKVSGRLDKLAVQEGDEVKKGQVLARIDAEPYQIALDKAAAALEIAKANYKKFPDEKTSSQVGVTRAEENLKLCAAQQRSARASLADAKRQLEETEALFGSGGTSKEALESAKSKYISYQAALEAADANLASADAALVDAKAKYHTLSTVSDGSYRALIQQSQADYNSARLALKNTVIKAPISGTVVRFPSQEGENLTAGQNVATVSNLKATWVTANIEEKKIGRIKPHQTVEIKVDAYPGMTLEGYVKEVGGASQSTFALISTENTSGNYTKVAQRFPVKIAILKPGVVLKPGMSAIVKIYTSK